MVLSRLMYTGRRICPSAKQYQAALALQAFFWEEGCLQWVNCASSPAIFRSVAGWDDGGCNAVTSTRKDQCGLTELTVVERPRWYLFPEECYSG